MLCYIFKYCSYYYYYQYYFMMMMMIINLKVLPYNHILARVLSPALTAWCVSSQRSTRLKYREQSNRLSQMINYTITSHRLSSLKCIHSPLVFIGWKLFL